MPSPQIGLPEITASRRPAGRRRTRVPVAGLTALVLVLAGVFAVNGQQAASAATVGAGSYTTTLPAGQNLPTGCGDLSTNPRQWITSNAPAGAIPTNDWWTSILWKKTNCSFGEPMFAHPAAYDAAPGGLGISYTTVPAITGTATGVSEYHFPFNRDVLVGVAGLNAPNVKVDDWSDWTVIADLDRRDADAAGDHRPRAADVVLHGLRRECAVVGGRHATDLVELRQHDRLHDP